MSLFLCFLNFTNYCKLKARQKSNRVRGIKNSVKGVNVWSGWKEGGGFGWQTDRAQRYTKVNRIKKKLDNFLTMNHYNHVEKM